MGAIPFLHYAIEYNYSSAGIESTQPIGVQLCNRFAICFGWFTPQVSRRLPF